MVGSTYTLMKNRSISMLFDFLMRTKTLTRVYEREEIVVQPVDYRLLDGKWRNFGPADSLNSTWNTLRDACGVCDHREESGFHNGTYYFSQTAHPECETKQVRRKRSLLTILFGTNIKMCPTEYEKRKWDDKRDRQGQKMNDLFPPHNPAVSISVVHRAGRTYSLTDFV
jgi:hypothetical protein